MSDLDELLSAFDGGLLLRPSHLVPNVVDLARALASLADAPDVAPSHNSDAVERLIGHADHLVFVLADGMGTEQVEALPEDAFLRLHLRAELQTVFPSSTAPAVTSFATGEWPEHAVTSGHVPRAVLESDLEIGEVRRPGREAHLDRVSVDRDLILF